jgi:hypothetical protein
MSRRGSTLLFAALVAAALSPAVQAATVRGTVTSRETGLQLPAMTVAAYSQAGALVETSTNALGEYSLSLGAGEYRFLAYDPAGVRATSFYDDASSFETSEIVSLAADATRRIDFRLIRAGWIRGSVLAAKDDTPLEGMVVVAYNLDGSRRGSTTTGAAGSFSLTLPPGSYKVAAWDDTLLHALQFHPAQFRFETAEPIAVDSGVEISPVELRLPRSAEVKGVVRDRDTGAGIAGATVTAYLDHRAQVSSVADSMGRFRILVPPTGLRLLAWDPAGIYATGFDGGAASFEATPLRQFEPADVVAGFDFVLVRGGRIEGRVRGSNGEPLSGVTVAAFNDDGSRRGMETTGVDGVYSLLVPPGAYKIGSWSDAQTHLEQFHPGVEKWESATPVSVASGQRLGGIDFLLMEAGRLRGVVRSSSYEPIEGLLVALYDTAGNEVRSGHTRADGTYALLAAPGEYRLLAADPHGVWATSYYSGAKNFESATPLRITAGEEFRADLEMTLAGRIAGTVRERESGVALSGLYVEAYDLAGMRIATVSTGGDGRFELILPAGSYKVVATDPLQRHARLWYDDASGFDDATVISVIVENQSTIELRLEPQSLPRQRAVRRR